MDAQLEKTTFDRPPTHRDGPRRAMRVFTPTCTLPEQATYVASGDVRGTLDIVWSCLSIVLLCTWSVLHLNVPLQTTVEGWWPKNLRALWRIQSKVRWMLWNLLAPEWNLGKAYADYVAVQKLYKPAKNGEAHDDGVWKDAAWSRATIYYANMGGFNIRFDKLSSEAHLHSDPTLYNTDDPEKGIASKEAHSIQVDHMASNMPRRAKSDPWRPRSQSTGAKRTRRKSEPHDFKPTPLPAHILSRFQKREKDGFFHDRLEKAVQKATKDMGSADWHVDLRNRSTVIDALHRLKMSHFSRSAAENFRTNPEAWICNLRVLCGSNWVVDANQLRLARQYGIIARLPEISEDQLDDLNKGDIFFKIVALGQIFWLIIQLGVRLGQGQPTTQLEILTLSFAISSILTYALLFDKPRNVETSILVNAARYATADEMIHIATAGPECFGILDTLSPDGTSNASGRLGLRIENDCTHMRTQVEVFIGGTAALTMFGGLHCIAWKFAFPTPAEHLLWRICAIITAAAVPIFILTTLPVLLFVFVRKRVKNKALALPFLWMFNGGSYAFIGLMVTVRVAILVEVFRSLAYQSPGAFSTTNWPASIPHIG